MTFKDDFHQSCVANGGTWGENADDGSYFCSINGVKITCNVYDRCTIQQDPSGGIHISPTRAGIGVTTILSPGSSTQLSIDLTRPGVEELLNMQPGAVSTDE